jgi:hypothetical protein
MKAIQAQLGHRSRKSTEQYAQLGKRAQLHIVVDLEPSAPPHVNLRSTSGRQPCAAARAGGEARRECAAKAVRSYRRGGRTTGGGGRAV